MKPPRSPTSARPNPASSEDTQGALFDDQPPGDPALPEGMVYQPGFLEEDEEKALVELIAGWPLEAMQYKAYTARRRVLSFGGKYDFDSHRLERSPPIPAQLAPLRDKVARWLGVPAAAFTQALVAEYSRGTPLGWHRDVPDFEDVVGVSLLDDAVMRLRPWPFESHRRGDVVKLPLQARSIYLLRGPSRWAWQHSVSPTRSLRYSITFRTASAAARRVSA